MTRAEFQQELEKLGFYHGEIDGIIGDQSRAATMQALTAGPDTPISGQDIEDAAKELDVTPAHIYAVYDVEATGTPFIDGRPTILFEPHRFSRATEHRFDHSHPTISYPHWGQRPYPRTQTARYLQLTRAVALDVDAAFASASYGAFQVLGENWKPLGYESPWDFAYNQSQSVGDQLEAFVRFVMVNHLAGYLRDCQWASFARRYNGTAFQKNHYDTRLAERFEYRRRALRRAA